MTVTAAAAFCRPRLPHGGRNAVAVAVARDFAFRLLTSPAVERAEHRSGTRGEEAHVSERSELCAAPSFREERREPMRRSRIGSRPAVLDQPFGCWKSPSFGYLFFARAKRRFFNSRMADQSNSLPEGERKLLTLPWILLVLLSLLKHTKAEAKLKARTKAFAPASHDRATFLCSCKEKVAKKKHALHPRPRHYMPRVHAAVGIFRHDIPVASKNDVHPCTSPLRDLVRRLRRCGREPGKANSTSQSNGNGNGNGGSLPLAGTPSRVTPSYPARRACHLW